MRRLQGPVSVERGRLVVARGDKGDVEVELSTVTSSGFQRSGADPEDGALLLTLEDGTELSISTPNEEGPGLLAAVREELGAGESTPEDSQPFLV